MVIFRYPSCKGNVLFSSDGKQLFIAATGTHSATGVSDSPLRMNRLNTPFDITTDRVKTDVISGCFNLMELILMIFQVEILEVISLTICT